MSPKTSRSSRPGGTRTGKKSTPATSRAAPRAKKAAPGAAKGGSTRGTARPAKRKTASAAGPAAKKSASSKPAAKARGKAVSKKAPAKKTTGAKKTMARSARVDRKKTGKAAAGSRRPVAKAPPRTTKRRPESPATTTAPARPAVVAPAAQAPTVTSVAPAPAPAAAPPAPTPAQPPSPVDRLPVVAPRFASHAEPSAPPRPQAPAPRPFEDRRPEPRREPAPASFQPAPAPPRPVAAPSALSRDGAVHPTPTSPAVVVEIPPAQKPPEIAHLTPAGPGHDEIFDKQTTFRDLGLRNSVVRGLEEAGFKHPTAIQAQLIPIILSGSDVLGQAKTGTGKTAAFALPLLHMLEKGTPFQGLCLVPTRELAIQVNADFKELGKHTPLRPLAVYGGQNIRTQADQLARGPEIIIATPGRVMDMHQRGYLHYNNMKMVVLDEVDRMLDIGFRDDIRRILSACPKNRQTIFVSATISGDIEALARTHARDAKKIVASAGSLTVSMVKQYHLPVAPWDKKQLLLHLLTHEEPTLTVVFCRTKKTVDNLTEYLIRKGIQAQAIHGDMYQGKRNKVIESLHAGKLSVLIASDLASRGLDVEGITHVVNYDLPDDPDLYVHRIGRTARAGREGIAWALVTPEQGELLTQIELLINAEIPKLDYPDFKPGPVPQDVMERQQRDAQRTEQAKSLNRFAATVAPPPVAVAAAAPDPHRFPGGIVPSASPMKRMFGRVKTARSLKQAMAQTPVPAPADGAPAPGGPSRS